MQLSIASVSTFPRFSLVCQSILIIRISINHKSSSILVSLIDLSKGDTRNKIMAAKKKKRIISQKYNYCEMYYEETDGIW